VTEATSTGLGLAIVDAVVAAHDGAVLVTSRPGMTRLTIVLPRLTEPAPPGAPAAPGVSGVSGASGASGASGPERRSRPVRKALHRS
jgi:two-component system OmpR family sensor kinase